MSLAEQVRPLLLAAGLGTRLRPLTLHQPKPLVRVCGRPVIDPLLDLLAAAGCTDVGLNTHWQAAALQAHVGDGRAWGLRLDCRHEPTLLGGAGTLRAFADFLGDQTALVLNADSVLIPDFEVLLAEHRAAGAVLSLLCTEFVGPLKRGAAWDEAGWLRGIRNWGLDDPRATHRGLFAGLHLVEPVVWQEFVAAEGPTNLVTDVIPALAAAGLPVRVLRYDGPFADIGDLAGLYQAQALVLARRLTAFLQPAEEVAPGVWVEPGARLAGTVEPPVYLAGGADVEAGARVGPYAVLWPGARLAAGEQLAWGQDLGVAVDG